MIMPSNNTANSTAVTNSSIEIGSTSVAPLEITTQEPEHSSHNSPRFNWDENQKQMIFGSFFWGYVLTELPGGRLAELVGGHRVFGHSMFWASVITLLTPAIAHMGFIAMVVQRVFLGFMLGGNFLDF
jgi:MFS transporter, ACS family, solute carrier family 17 (sodium-dependent inorganic phosphate cotransporter), other